jgi:hypothetical protein
MSNITSSSRMKIRRERKSRFTRQLLESTTIKWLRTPV